MTNNITTMTKTIYTLKHPYTNTVKALKITIKNIYEICPEITDIITENDLFEKYFENFFTNDFMHEINNSINDDESLDLNLDSDLGITCMYIFTRGKNKNEQCSNKALVNGYCSKHKEKASKKIVNKNVNSKSVNSESENVNNCVYVFTRGKNKNEQCGNKALVNGYCSKHKSKANIKKIVNVNSKSVNSESESENINNCIYVFTRGKNKNEQCGNKALVNGYCSKHKANASKAQTKTEETSLDLVKRLIKDKNSSFSNSPSNTPKNDNENNRCVYVFLKGKNIGKNCFEPTNGNKYCKKHNKNTPVKPTPMKSINRNLEFNNCVDKEWHPITGLVFNDDKTVIGTCKPDSIYILPLTKFDIEKCKRFMFDYDENDNTYEDDLRNSIEKNEKEFIEKLKDIEDNEDTECEEVEEKVEEEVEGDKEGELRDEETQRKINEEVFVRNLRMYIKVCKKDKDNKMVEDMDWLEKLLKFNNADKYDEKYDPKEYFKSPEEEEKFFAILEEKEKEYIDTHGEEEEEKEIEEEIEEEE